MLTMRHAAAAATSKPSAATRRIATRQPRPSNARLRRRPQRENTSAAYDELSRAIWSCGTTTSTTFVRRATHRRLSRRSDTGGPSPRARDPRGSVEPQTRRSPSPSTASPLPRPWTSGIRFGGFSYDVADEASQSVETPSSLS